MSRNIGQNYCYFCNGRGSGIELEEDPRHITEDEAGLYYPTYAGMMVAKARCPDCEAKYLAWIDSIPHYRKKPSQMIQDLSFRSTFNDEPDDDDLPRWHVVEHIELERVSYSWEKPENTVRWVEESRGERKSTT